MVPDVFCYRVIIRVKRIVFNKNVSLLGRGWAIFRKHRRAIAFGFAGHSLPVIGYKQIDFTSHE